MIHKLFCVWWTVLLVLSSLALPVYAGEGEASEKKEELHIYLLIGQSNMAGRAPIEEQDKAPIEGVFLLNEEDAWEPAKVPLNRYSTIRHGIQYQKLNPGYTFAKKMRTANPLVPIGLIVNARGGTSILLWKKNSPFYDEAIRRTHLTMTTGTLRGILWHQGETDSEDAAYLEKLKQLIEDLRTDLGIKELPFVAGQINNIELINQQISRLPDEVPFTGFTSSAGLQAVGRWHFDTPSMRTLEERYASEMLKLHAD